jgi:chromosome partitioning protein
MAFIISVANEKGGVAKTTTVVSLAGALIESQHDVLVIDLDPQANLTLALGVDPAKVRRSIANVLLDSASLLSTSRETSLPGLDLVPSNAEMSSAERFLPVRQNYHSLLRSSLENLLSYSFVLIDCPPSLGAVTWNALTAANLLIIPTQPEYFSAHALRSTLVTAKRICAQTNPGLIYRLLITMLDQRNRIHRTLRDQLKCAFGDTLFNTSIDTDTKLRESPVVGLPITHYHAHTRSAQQYRALAQEIMAYVEKTGH